MGFNRDKTPTRLKPYRAPGFQNSQQNGYFIDGPGNGFGYDAGYLWPECAMATPELAEIVSEMCNEAHAQGYWAAQADMRKALGLEK